MRPKERESTPQEDLFRSRLDQIINRRHELVTLGEKLDWERVESELGPLYAEAGRPGIETRLIVGLHLLKHIFGLSDEQVCERWEYDPYFQYFCGQVYFAHHLPMNRSSMSRWRQRVGEEACRMLLQVSLETAYRTKALRKDDVKRVVVDTTVQPKAVTYPTDGKLYYKALCDLVKRAKKEGIRLRQTYLRVGKRALVKASRYSHAKQMRRMMKQLKFLRKRLGRVVRDIDRRIAGNERLEQVFGPLLGKARKLILQRRQDSNKLYSWHAPEVECIGKGKADKPYEFGCKVSVVSTINPAPAGHFVLSSEALHGRPYDGHTLNGTLKQTHANTGITSERVYVDRGYVGHNYPKRFKVFRSGQKRGVTAAIKRELRRRSVIEPVIGHMKNDGHLGRNYLKGQLGDRINALLSGIGHNLRLLLRWFRQLFIALCSCSPACLWRALTAWVRRLGLVWRPARFASDPHPLLA